MLTAKHGTRPDIGGCTLEQAGMLLSAGDSTLFCPSGKLIFFPPAASFGIFSYYDIIYHTAEKVNRYFKIFYKEEKLPAVVFLKLMSLRGTAELV